jgi:hypothetical protein
MYNLLRNLFPIHENKRNFLSFSANTYHIEKRSK